MADQRTAVNAQHTPPPPVGAHEGSSTPQPSGKVTSSNSSKNGGSASRVFSSKESKKGTSDGVDSTSHKSLPQGSTEEGKKESRDSAKDTAGSNKHSAGKNCQKYYDRPRQYSRSRGYGKDGGHGNSNGDDGKAQPDQERDKRTDGPPSRGPPKSRPRPPHGQSGAKNAETTDRIDCKDGARRKERVDEDTKLDSEKDANNPSPKRGQKSYPKIPRHHDQGNARNNDSESKASRKEKLAVVSERSGQDAGGDGGTRDSRSDVRSHQGRGRNYRGKNKDFKDPHHSKPKEKSVSQLRRSEPLASQNPPEKNEFTSDKTDMVTTAIKSSDPFHRDNNISAKNSLPGEKMSSSHSKETKRTESANYTKRKHEKSSQQSGFKGRQKGLKSAPTVQSDQLAHELTAGTYECMVCYERVRGRDQVWSCEGCYHVFHLKCIKKWASAPVLGTEEGTPDGWQCPSCRKIFVIVPTVYRCFCGRVVSPRQKGRGELTVPHTCGDTCLKSLAVGPQSNCKHKCRLPCHPGPCPPCPVMVRYTCPCGKKSYQVRCSRIGDLPSCGGVCGRGLTCGRHTCEENCHSGACPTCEKVLNQQCHCGRETRQSCCGEEKSLVFSCGQICKKELDCGNHLCELLCHEGPCPSCSLLPSAVITCPCGATPLSSLLPEGKERISCYDPIPTCNLVCGKTLPCSTNSDDPHCCPATCHLGVCPPCDKTSSIRCMCGSSTCFLCVEVVSGKGVELKCERVCNKKKSCGRHRCNVRCCVDKEHKCELLCGKKLQCGLHYCQENCHRGHCEQCWEISYSELTCHCGTKVIPPPIPCGTRPPPCTRRCARKHPCKHRITHSCHNDQSCPPCPVLTTKMCMGRHKFHPNVPCHLTDISCRVACDRSLPCNMHKCQRKCHRGNCDDLPCQQPCTNKRKSCDHPCGEPCHDGGACPDTPCKALVELKCECGRKKEKMVCMISESGVMRQTFQQKSLKCGEVCRQLRRKKELAVALGIECPSINPLESGSSGETVQYSVYLLEEARLNFEFVAEVEEKLRTLVEASVKGPADKIHNCLLQPMKSSSQWKIVNELSAYYGCETVHNDQEPLTNIPLYAVQSQVKLPPVPLTKLIERERYKAPPAPLHVMTVSEKTGPAAAKKLAQLEPAETVPDYFADDFKL